MSKMLLIVSHAPSPNTCLLRDAVIDGARNEDVDDIDVVAMPAFDATSEHVLACDGIILGTTENLGYMSGALKDFFDRTYYSIYEKTDALPCAFWIRAGMDGTGSRRALDSITGGLRWRRVVEPLICKGQFHESFQDECRELGLTMAAGLEAGVF